MTETKNWTDKEDQTLKLIRDQHGVQKWSTIAQIMAQQYHFKGRNGKQCKQRYMEVFDTNKQVLHWDYQAEQQMIILHDKIGNKWAAIGQQLKNRTDNDVKNHFYSKIRKGLRKVNYIIKDYFRKQFKEIKQTILYKIIEGTQDRFSANPIHEEDVWNFCTEAKNLLLRMSYDENEYNPWNDFKTHQQTIREFIDNLTFFSKEFKRKPKIFKKNEAQEQSYKNMSLQTSVKIPLALHYPHNGNSICDSQNQSSEVQQSHSEQVEKMNMSLFQSGFLPPHKLLFEIPVLPRKPQKINPVIILKSSNELTEMIQQKQGMELKKTKSQKQQKQLRSSSSLLPFIPKLVHISSKNSNAMIDEEDQDLNRIHLPVNNDHKIQYQLMRQGLLQQDDQKFGPQFPLFNGNSSKNITSKGSNFSSYSIDEEQQVHFFQEDSTLNMRIYTTGVGGKMKNSLQQSIDKSDKLFKSLDKDQQLFQQFDSRGKRDFQMSIQRSGDLQKSSSLFQSVGR